MLENNENLINLEQNKTKIFKNGIQSATNYVQNAIENAAEPTQDATQNLVNNVMKRRRDGENR